LIPETATPTRPLTGRAVTVRMVRVDRCHRLDTRGLRRGGVFKKPAGTMWTVIWQRPFPVLMRCRLVESDGQLCLGILNASQASAGEDAPLAQRLLLQSVPCRYGGRRWYFRCECGARRRVLHLVPEASRFACRGCTPLTYESRQCHRDRWYQGIWHPLALMQRMVADLGSRSPRRKLRAMWRCDPQAVIEAIRKDLEARALAQRGEGTARV